VNEEEDLIPAEEPGSQIWYISWADMTTLLLTFFIVLFTFSTISTNKFIEATSSIQRAFHLPIQVGVPVKPDLAADRQAQEIQDMIEQEALVGILAQDFGDRIVLTMDTDVAFEIGRADLSAEGARILERILPALEKAPGEIRIEGHTCDLPVSAGSPFRDNWGLSTARAVRVLETLVQKGFPPKRIGGVPPARGSCIREKGPQVRGSDRRAGRCCLRAGGVSHWTGDSRRAFLLARRLSGRSNGSSRHGR
jgi:chemotaxis protein MotB